MQTAAREREKGVRVGKGDPQGASVLLGQLAQSWFGQVQHWQRTAPMQSDRSQCAAPYWHSCPGGLSWQPPYPLCCPKQHFLQGAKGAGGPGGAPRSRLPLAASTTTNATRMESIVGAYCFAQLVARSDRVDRSGIAVFSV